jgi:putative hydrolase of the HAD superfamily
MSRLIVFDLDDTLYLERDFVRSGFRAVEALLGRRGFFEAAWRRFRAGERGTIFDGALADLGVCRTRSLIRRLVARYRTHPARIRLCRDAARFLRRPPQAHLAIISDGPLAAQRTKVRALRLRGLVHAVVLTARLGQRYAKPHPRAFRTVMRRFRASPADCLYVADNPAKDFDAPRALGWRFVRLRRAGGLHANVASPGIPEIRSCDELTRWL